MCTVRNIMCNGRRCSTDKHDVLKESNMMCSSLYQNKTNSNGIRFYDENCKFLSNITFHRILFDDINSNGAR